MTILRRIFGNWWIVSSLAALLAAIALCLLLPMAWRAVAPAAWRLTLLGLVVAVWGGLALWKLISARQASERIARSLAEAERSSGEEQVLGKRMSDALAQLRAASGNRRDYLYDRPWYVIIGPPGGGKTTALLKSGLRFPYSDSALKGAGGTRNLDFWFSDEAVMIDTAGRYTSQDSGQDRDAQGWRAFLDLLRRNRPLQPVNGVIVAVPLDTLAGSDVHALDNHAATIRRRIAELQTGLEIEVPVYVMFTKADLIAGFSEFYDDLDVDGRRAVLGSTFPWGPDGPVDAAAITHGFDDLFQAISDRTAKRLQEVQDPRRRALIIGFPGQVSALRSRIVRLLDGAFPSAANAKPGRLRGFYLTSGVQEGTPLDLMMSSMAQVYDQPHQAAGGAGRAYFINRLLTEVIFEEAGLVQTSPALARKRRAMILASSAAIGLVSVMVLGAWVASYAANRQFQKELAQEARAIFDEAGRAGVNFERYAPDADIAIDGAEPYLTRLAGLPGGFEQSRKGPPLAMRFGLYQWGLSRRARETYLGGLQRVMSPRLMVRLETALDDNSDPMASYERLKSYMLLGGLGPKPEPKAVQAWAQRDWEAYSLAGDDRAELRKRLGRHLSAMLDDPRYGRVWGGKPPPLDADRVRAAQGALTAMPLADRAYAILKQSAAEGGSDWQVAAVLDKGALSAFADPEAVGDFSTPWFFTKAGYKVFRVGLETLPQRLKSELWVLGEDQGKEAITSQLSSLKAGVAQKYAADYERAWDGLVDLMRPGDYFGDAVAYDAIKRTPSPLAVLMRQLRNETSFTDDLVTKAAQAGANRALSSRPQFLRDSLAARVSTDAGGQITLHFAELHAYVGTGKSEADVDRLILALRQFVEASEAAKYGADAGGMASDGLQARVAEARAALASAASDAPAALRPFADALLNGTAGVQVQAAREALNGAYKTAVLGQCMQATGGAFPFVLSSTSDASLSLMRQTFGDTGAFGGFIRDRIVGAQLVSTDGPMWRWRDDNALAATLQPSSAEEFQKARRIGELLADGLQMSVQAVGFGGAVTAVDLVEGGRTHRLGSGGEPVDVFWNAIAGPSAQLVLLGGGGEVARFRGDGAWALFRLFAQASLKGDEPPAFTAVFRKGAASVTLLVRVKGEVNPFGRSFWALRCPGEI